MMNPDEQTRHIVERRIAKINALFDSEDGCSVMAICHGCDERKPTLMVTRFEQHGHHVEKPDILQVLCMVCAFGENFDLPCIPLIRSASIVAAHFN